MPKILRIAIGITLIVLGVLALLTPLTPGSWLALIGLEILGVRRVIQRRLLSIIPVKYRQTVRDYLEKAVKRHKSKV
jgi:hypothetical protein